MMAGDLQFTYGGHLKMKGKSKIFLIPDDTSKMLFNSKSAVIGFCGNADQFGPALAWLESLDGKPPKCKSLETVVLTKKGDIYHSAGLGNWMKVDDPFFAIGSGMQYAMAAMGSGKDPYEAVKIASKFDPMTGLGFNKIEL